MWLSIIERHFPQARWKKYYSKIMFNILALFYGLKPSFLWDIGPNVTADELLNFVKTLKGYFDVSESILIVVIGSDIVVVNGGRCLRTLFSERLFVEVEHGGCKLVNMSGNESLKEAMKLLKDKCSYCEGCEIWSFPPEKLICPVTLFGVLLNYPIVYYFKCDYQPFYVELSVFIVVCHFELDNIFGKFQAYSFSVPRGIVDSNIEQLICHWFTNIKVSRSSIFKNLTMEKCSRNVDALILCHLLKEAANYFQKCLSLEPYFLRARHNLDNLTNLAVERWHFRMLNDVHRNHAFRAAIKKKIQQGFNRVLDIGTGTGLLSLFCIEGKATEIYACDSSKVMVEVASRVLKDNDAHTVKLIYKHSTDLLVPSDIPERVSLLVTETFDSGLLGEGILLTLSHAWRYLLLPPGPENNSARVIPHAGQLYVTAIECDSISRRFHGNLSSVISLVSNVNTCLIRDGDSYDTQDLTLVNFKYLTKVEKLPLINFNDPSAIEEVLSGDYDKELILECTESGRLDCFAVWFDLLLDDEIILRTGPQSRRNEAWEQAVFPSSQNLFIRKGEEIGIRVSLGGGKLCVEHPLGHHTAGLKASENLIRVLNDPQLTGALVKLSDKLSKAFRRSIRLMDWFPFPVFGWAFLMSRKDYFQDEVVCFVSSDEDAEVVSFFAKHYGVQSRIIIERELSIENYCFAREQFDVIIVNLIESTGEIKENCVANLKNLRSLLKPDGIIFPEKVTVVGQFVHSNWLLKASQMAGNESTCGYNVEHINCYQAQHFIDFDPGIEKVHMSHPFPIFALSEKEVFFDTEIPIVLTDGCINAMIYWFTIKFTEESTTVSTNDRTSAFNQSAFIFPETNMRGEEKVRCRVVARDGLFRVQLLPDDRHENSVNCLL